MEQIKIFLQKYTSAGIEFLGGLASLLVGLQIYAGTATGDTLAVVGLVATIKGFVSFISKYFANN